MQLNSRTRRLVPIDAERCERDRRGRIEGEGGQLGRWPLKDARRYAECRVRAILRGERLHVAELTMSSGASHLLVCEWRGAGLNLATATGQTAARRLKPSVNMGDADIVENPTSRSRN